MIIGYPPETLQDRIWQQQLVGQARHYDESLKLVERYPMHPNKIEAVCREARIRSHIEYGSKDQMFAFIEKVILESRSQ